MVRGIINALLLPVRAVDSLLQKVFGEPIADETLALRDANERAEEFRRQIDRSHR